MSNYRKPRASTALVLYALLGLVVLAWFVKFAAFIAVVLFISLLVEVIEHRRNVKRSQK